MMLVRPRLYDGPLVISYLNSTVILRSTISLVLSFLQTANQQLPGKGGEGGGEEKGERAVCKQPARACDQTAITRQGPLPGTGKRGWPEGSLQAAKRRARGRKQHLPGRMYSRERKKVCQALQPCGFSGLPD